MNAQCVPLSHACLDEVEGLFPRRGGRVVGVADLGGRSGGAEATGRGRRSAGTPAAGSIRR